MALKESNKNRRKAQQAELEQVATCSYITRIIFGCMFIVGAMFSLINTFIFPNL